ncbi:MAG TPA: ABC transporter substrate-binding protein, partial [Chloroflexota bacterium]|nr:ABC transporter substrate-binding protein [Chloroflexota bacterium]
MRRLFQLAVLLSLGLAACQPSQPAAQPTSPPAPKAAESKPAAQPPAAATAAPAAKPAAQQSSKDTITIVFQANQGTLDAHFAVTNQELLVTRNIYNSLLKYKPNTTELTGDLVTRWDVSGDGLTYTFQLRQDVEWQKGFGHFTANDVKASFERVKSPETKSPFAGSVSMLKEVQVV